jgi:polyphosphate glucokinase
MVKPMELGHLPYKKRTYEDYVGRAGLERDGKKKWQRHVVDVVERLKAALQPDDTVIGGGNVKKLDALPPQCRAGENANAFSQNMDALGALRGEFVKMKSSVQNRRRQ